MSNYIPNKQKKNKIFHKREIELRHAIKHRVDPDPLEKAAAMLRDAKLAAIKAQFAETGSPERDRLLNKWAGMTLDDIVAMYTKGMATE